MIRLISIALFWGCSGTQYECAEDVPCGFGETCVDGSCVEARCATSAQCPMESYCLQGDCRTGCAEDNDCYPGDACNLDSRECEAAACTNTQVDCAFKEFCNTATGSCYDAGGMYCHFCDEDAECGEGNICYAHYCGVDCSSGQECPSGFECSPFVDEFGNVVTYQCWTICSMFEEAAVSGGLRPLLESEDRP